MFFIKKSRKCKLFFLTTKPFLHHKKYIFAASFMAIIAQLVRVPDCGSEGRGFESPWSPENLEKIYQSVVLPLPRSSQHIHQSFCLSAGHHTHHLAHIVKLFHQFVYFLYIGSASVGNPFFAHSV